MAQNTFLISTPKEIERRRALEFLALTPTEKYDALIELITISNEVRKAGEAVYHNKKRA